jgi:hypothetical protein
MRVLELEDVILLLRSEVIRFLRSTRKSLYALISISVGSVGISDIAAFRDRARKHLVGFRDCLSPIYAFGSSC